MGHLFAVLGHPITSAHCVPIPIKKSVLIVPPSTGSRRMSNSPYDYVRRTLCMLRFHAAQQNSFIITSREATTAGRPFEGFSIMEPFGTLHSWQEENRSSSGTPRSVVNLGTIYRRRIKYLPFQVDTNFRWYENEPHPMVMYLLWPQYY